MSVKSLNHIGIAVRSIDDQKAYYTDTLGLEYEGMEDVPSQKVRVAFFNTGDVRIELLEATEPDSPVAKFIDKRGEGLHHLHVGVEDVVTKPVGNLACLVLAVFSTVVVDGERVDNIL